jgi:hypothetical protein
VNGAGRPAAAADDGLEAYVEAIEAHLRARRGVDHVLSPRDFGLARSWHGSGVPLATVLVGIDRAFDAGADVTSLGFCRRRVEDLVAAGPRPESRPSPASEGVPLEEVARLLQLLHDHLAPLRSLAGFFEPPLRKIREVQDLLAVAIRPNYDYLRLKLREIDDLVSAAAMQALGPEEMEGFRAEASRAVERHRGRLDEAAIEDARARYALQRARERFDLPRVCLI